MSSYRLIPHVTSKDAMDLGRNNISAFYQETWWRMLWPSSTLEELCHRTGTRFYHRLQQDRETLRQQIVRDENTGEIVGYARWILPESASHEWLEAQVPEATAEQQAEYKRRYDTVIWKLERPELDRLDDWIAEQRAELAPKTPYIKLDYLAVGPRHQGQGIATMLVKSGIEQGNKLNMDIFFVAMGQKARGMYLKNGFTELSGKVQDLKPYGEDDVYETYMMIKHPDTAV